MVEKSWSKDLLASVVVFLVALPLCMGIAIASGVPPALGLITGIIGGVIVGFLAGSPLQVSGPAAGLAVLVYQLVQEHGLVALGGVVLMAGLIQLAAGMLKLGQWFRAMSPSVIYGMLAGIGVLIFASQFHVMVDDSPRDSGVANLLSIPVALYKGVFPLDGSTHHLAASIGLLTIVTLLLWNRFRPKSLKMIPSALVSVVVASIAASIAGLPIKRIEVPANIMEATNIPTWASLQALAEVELLTLGVVFAFVASAETLLCASAVDRMHSGERTNYDRELTAQGVGNMLCGALGSLPMTGVIVRSSANVQAGATSRRSAILHGAWLLSTVAIFPWLLNHIPMAALAAILVYTGYKLVNIAEIRKIARFGRAELLIYAGTLIGIVETDLLHGVLIGFGLSLLKLVWSLSHVGVREEISPDGKRADLHLTGAATFLGIPRLSGALERIPRGAEVHLHIDELDHIDHACLDLLGNWETQHEKSGGSLKIEWDELVDRYHRGAALADPANKKKQAQRTTAKESTLVAMGRSE